METATTISVTDQPLAPLHDIRDVPQQKPDMILFVDGSCPRGSTGHPASGRAVCTSTKALEAYPLPNISSVQIAELAVPRCTSALAQEQSAPLRNLCLHRFLIRLWGCARL